MSDPTPEVLAEHWQALYALPHFTVIDDTRYVSVGDAARLIAERVEAAVTEARAENHPADEPAWSELIRAAGEEAERAHKAETERDAALARAEELEPLTKFVDRHGWIVGTSYMVGEATDHVVHAEPCDCDEDEESVGTACMAASESYRGLLHDEGAHGMSVVGMLQGPNDINERLRRCEDDHEDELAAALARIGDLERDLAFAQLVVTEARSWCSDDWNAALWRTLCLFDDRGASGGEPL